MNIIGFEEGAIRFEVRRQRFGDTFECWIDAADGELLHRYRWAIVEPSNTTKLYLATKIDGRSRRMQGLLAEGGYIHHINGDGLDNRRGNLLVSTSKYLNRSPKPPGSTGMRGVTRSSSGRYIAQVWRSGRSEYIGSFESAIEASLAYEAAV